MSDKEFTIGDPRRHLQNIPDDTKLTFGGGITFYRIKNFGDEAYIEWIEAEADLDPGFQKRNPHIKVAFVKTESTEWDEGGIVGSTDVSIA